MPVEHSDTDDIVTELVKDHREVEEMFARLEQLAGGTSDEAKTVTEKVIKELVRHSVAEEAYLYPTVRDRIVGGDALADEELREHAEAEQTMKAVEGLDPSDAQFWPTVHRLMAEIRQHVAEEESDLFPRLREAVSDEELRDLGDKARMAKSVAPTRPHPSAPDKPPMNKLLAPGTGLVDRVRDAISGRAR